MPNFEYEIRDKSGKLIKSRARSEDKDALIKMLQEQGAMILSVREAQESTGAKKRKLHNKVTLRDLAFFAKTMATLIENGITIIEAFDVVVQQIDSKPLLEAIRSIKKQIEGGSSFRDALAAYPKIFDNYWIDMMEAGELSGKLPYVLREILKYIEAREQMRKKIISAMTYPIILICGCVAAILVLILKIVPVFKDLFASFNKELPPITKMVLALSENLQQYGAGVFLAIVVIGIAINRTWATDTGRRFLERILFKVPVLGVLMQSSSIEKFVSSLSALLKSGIPILKGLEVSAKTAQSIVFEDEILGAKMQVTAGIPLSEALNSTGLFPPIVVQLLLVSEKTGNFSGMLDEIALYYKEQIDMYITRLTSMIEPIITIGMTAVIGVILGSVFMPIFSLSSI